MIQVENEIGMIPTRATTARRPRPRFRQPVPAELMAVLCAGRDADRLAAGAARRSGRARARSREARGPRCSARAWPAEEVFMAWHFARYHRAVAAAGKAEYPLPMFVNAALIRPGFQPGQYPSGGPLPHLIDVWRAAAPAIDFLAPDIYFPNFAEWTRALRPRPATRCSCPRRCAARRPRSTRSTPSGQHDAIGFCPFAIESIGEPAASLLAASNDTAGAARRRCSSSTRATGRWPDCCRASAEQRQPQQVRARRLRAAT